MTELRRQDLVAQADREGILLARDAPVDETMALTWPEVRWLMSAALPALAAKHDPLPTARVP